jgi:hypothetical protein
VIIEKIGVKVNFCPEAGVTGSSETLVISYQTIRCHNVEEHDLNFYCAEGVEPHSSVFAPYKNCGARETAIAK